MVDEPVDCFLQLLGRNVRRERFARWLSRAELGAKAGFSEQQVAAIESGQLDLWVSDCVRLMQALHSNPFALFLGAWTSDPADPIAIAAFVDQVRQLAQARGDKLSSLAKSMCGSAKFGEQRLVKLLNGERFVVMSDELEDLRRSLMEVQAE